MTIKVQKTILLNAEDNTSNGVVTSLRSVSKIVDNLSTNYNVQMNTVEGYDGMYTININPITSMLELFRGCNKFKGLVTITTTKSKQKIDINLERSLNLSGWFYVLVCWVAYFIPLLFVIFSINNDTNRAYSDIQKALDDLEFQYS